MDLRHVVIQLPEIYQPIFGHPELSSNVSRICEDRFSDIKNVYDLMSKHLGRPLRVLDLGCSQGFFSFRLAALGATVVGVDYLDKNIAVCQALQKENPTFDIDFRVELIERTIEELQPEQFDLVLGLSIFHHLCHKHGFNYVQELVSKFATHCGALIVELATKNEPVYWAQDLPEDPSEFLNHVAFVRQMSKNSTHLSEFKRPLFVVSNKYWVFEKDISQFNYWKDESHNLSNGTHERTRRYFFSENQILKRFSLVGSRNVHNLKEFTNEKQFLENLPASFKAPKLKLAVEDETELWILTEKLAGKLLLDMIRDNLHIDAKRIIRSILSQLVALEQIGLFHNDVRIWNVIITDSNEPLLIDFGSISKSFEDVSWPRNPYLSFFIFINEVVRGIAENPVPLRPIFVSPLSLPYEYQNWGKALWETPLDLWSFKLMYEKLLSVDESDDRKVVKKAEDLWKVLIEDALQISKSYLISKKDKALEVSHSAENKAAQALEVSHSAENKAAQALEVSHSAENKAAQALEVSHSAENKAAQALKIGEEAVIALNAILSSKSWKITAPFRRIKSKYKTINQVRMKISRSKITRVAIIQILHSVLTRKKIKKVILVVLTRFGIKETVKKYYSKKVLRITNGLKPRPNGEQNSDRLSVHSRTIYLEIKKAIEERN